jgi:hypothetical protein
MKKTIKIKDIEHISTVDKICKQPQNRVKDKNICYDCPLFLGFACYANIMYLIDQEIEVEGDKSE